MNELLAIRNAINTYLERPSEAAQEQVEAAMGAYLLGHAKPTAVRVANTVLMHPQSFDCRTATELVGESIDRLTNKVSTAFAEQFAGLGGTLSGMTDIDEIDSIIASRVNAACRAFNE